MRQYNIPIEMKLLNVKEANERAKHHDLHKFERSLFFRRNFKKIEDIVPKIRPKLPGLDITIIPLFIQTVSFLLFYWLVKNNDKIEKNVIYRRLLCCY